jgi:DNA replication protein DnaC
MGMRVIQQPNGRTAAEPCECQARRRVETLYRNAKIPPRYEHCTLDNYDLLGSMDASLREARLTAKRYAEDYPIGTEEKGLLLTGDIGVGKTHLAVGLLRALISEKHVQGLFCDYRELLKEIQSTYNPSTQVREMDILRPVFRAEVLVLDELGAVKPTEWVWDTVALVLNTRYNEKRVTIITTNYPDSAPSQSAAIRDETLGDRIGERLRSRLAEMCVTVAMHGNDFRQGIKKARFSRAAY